jgi:hypothetical protein
MIRRVTNVPVPEAGADTRDDDYPRWLALQTEDALGDLLRYSGVRPPEALRSRLTRCVLECALVSRCVAERVTPGQARSMVLALAVMHLLLNADTLLRLAPPWPPSGDELDVLREYAETGSWRQVRPEAEVTAARRRVQRRATARLPLADALLVGILRSAGGPDEAARALDLDDAAARRALAGAGRRWQVEVIRCVEEALHAVGLWPAAGARAL